MDPKTFATSDGALLHYDDSQSGSRADPLLLLHGLTGTHDDWQHVFDLAALAARARVIRPDARGHGRSTNPSGAFTFARCARDVVELLDHLAIERVRAVGVSLGAKTLLHLATMAPSRIAVMVLVSATPRFPEATRALFRAAAAAPRSEDEWALMRANHPQGDAAIRALWSLPARLADDASEMHLGSERLALVQAPTLLVAGDRDPLYPIELAVELYRHIPQASLYVVPGGGHAPVFGNERDAFVARALPFLGLTGADGLDASSPSGA
jgi:pimeloyl-ACP methyl ester carboxylesterase